MDFVAESEDGRVFDVEMQNRKEGNIPKRTRFYQALMDAPLLKSGEKGFDKLKKPYSHEIIGPLGHGVGVCEGIAKSVKVLCDVLGIWCMIAV